MKEKKIMTLILNYPELYSEFKKYNLEFHDPDCLKLFEIIEILYTKNKIFNRELIVNYIVDNRTMDLYKFYEIIDIIEPVENFKIYINEMLTKKTKDKIIEYSVNLSNDNIKNNTEIKYEILDIANNIKSVEEEEIKTSKEICIDLLEKLKDDYKIEKVYSGIEFFQKHQGGYDLSDFILIGASESVGKTSYIIDIILKQLKRGMKIVMFSCEMKKDKIYQLFACNIADINSNKVDNNILDKLEKERYIEAISNMYESNLIVIDNTRNWEEIKNQIRIFKNKDNIDMVYIDYMHYLRVPEVQKLYDRLEIISGDSKDLAKTLNIPICQIVTLNREGKKDHEPQTYHIKGNGDIEYDADIILLLHTFCDNIDNNYNERIIKFFVRKNRNGIKNVDYNMKFIASKRKFIDESIY